ncbi:MAG: hypothetical protein M3Y87_33085, partial [Myxococcota bacterium]|nr:hypothetical protein [Myxococcota bacterium]
MRTTLSTFAIAMAACLALGAAFAARASAQRAIVLDFSGPGSSAVRGEVVSAIESGGWEVASSSDVSRASAS